MFVDPKYLDKTLNGSERRASGSANFFRFFRSPSEYSTEKKLRNAALHSAKGGI